MGPDRDAKSLCTVGQAVHCPGAPSLRDTVHIIDVNLCISFDNFQINESVVRKGHLFKIPAVVSWGLAAVLEVLAPALALELSPRIIPTGQHALGSLTFLLDEIERIPWGVVTQRPFCKVNGRHWKSLLPGGFLSPSENRLCSYQLLRVRFCFNITFWLRPPIFPCPLP